MLPSEINGQALADPVAVARRAQGLVLFGRRRERWQRIAPVGRLRELPRSSGCALSHPVQMGRVAAQRNSFYGGAMSGGAKEIQGLGARRAALRLLDAVLRRGETLDQATGPATVGLLTSSDAGLARAIAGEALRWIADLDSLIDSATRQRLADDAKARTVLRIMLAQWLRLETPAHVVVATGLPMLSGGPRRLAHGVFGTLVRAGATLPAAPTLPLAVAERWGKRAVAIATGLADPPPLDLALRDRSSTERWRDEFAGVSFTPGHVRLPRGKAVHDLRGFDTGDWWVQDFAATLPARILRAQPGEEVLDLCAAPGGKALQLAADLASVTMVDVSARRIERIEQNFSRVGLSYTDLVCADALTWDTDKRFDAILLDAPCTATGTARRHPDVLHRVGPRQIELMAELQSRLLARAPRWLKPGGRLVYAVCSLEREEGEEQAARVSLARDPIRPEELPDGFFPTPEGWLRTDPGMLPEHGGMDGFFIARFVNNT
jgi:16S rRNA (cytosine967-C5)-methyltransferase